MLNKSFAELSKVVVSDYVSKRDGADYLPWTACKDLLHQNGAEEVWFDPVLNEDGSSLFMSRESFTSGKTGQERTNRCYEVRVKIHVDDKEWIQNYPLMNGSNPVFDNSLNQLRVNNAQARAFVKGVAIRLGLGWSLWSDNCEPEEEEEDLRKHSLWKIKERLQEEYTLSLKKLHSTAEVAKAVDMTEDEVRTLFTYFDQLDRFEKKLTAI